LYTETAGLDGSHRQLIPNKVKLVNSDRTASW